MPGAITLEMKTRKIVIEIAVLWPIPTLASKPKGLILFGKAKVGRVTVSEIVSQPARVFERAGVLFRRGRAHERRHEFRNRFNPPCTSLTLKSPERNNP